MTSTRSNTRSNPDPLFKHVVTVILGDKAPIKACLSGLGITTYRDLLDLMKDHNKVNSLKWRNGSADEDLPDYMKEQLMFVPSYLNYLQNNHGTMMNHPIDTINVATRDKYNMFLRLSPTERCGNPDGTVDYDLVQARESEKFNQLGIFATQATPTQVGGSHSSTAGTTSSSKPSKASIELQALMKKQSLSDAKIDPLESPADWERFHVAVLTRLKIHDMAEMAKHTYTPPSVVNGDDPDEVLLYEKRSNLLYESLSAPWINTDAGKIVVKEYRSTTDGFACWKKIEKHYEDDVAAETRAEHFRVLICTSKIDPEKHRGLSEEINRFKGWVLEYNHFCGTGSEMDDLTQYTHFTTYITNVPELKYVRQLIDVQEHGLTGKKTTATPEQKIAFYYREAQKIDAAAKTKMIEMMTKNKRFSVNAMRYSDGELWDLVDPYSYSANVGLISGDGGYLQSDMQPYQTPFYDINATLQEAEVYYGQSGEDDSEARRYGYLPKSLYNAMDPEHRKLWMSIPAKSREMIITYRGPSPPSISEEHRLPGTGIAGRKARATNQAEGDRQANVTEMTIINAMRANATRTDSSRRKRAPFVPARLMSKTNKSPNELIPLKRSNLVSADREEIQPEAASNHEEIWGTN